ncbi:hypothetical protein [Nostoc parmelioides]|uniref:Uncharacterized protein n=1 Tax=Nostoc parmelioides FACHB-3921 TaxID=2692909 RepID=A0ABR8BPM1_9NOSO|nr:hypothetical protein [Nostoc parmelioides]MBD2255933.1 hypothetical protein [Nostoc parmelioides FACHB-3921]
MTASCEEIAFVESILEAVNLIAVIEQVGHGTSVNCAASVSTSHNKSIWHYLILKLGNAT